MENTVITSHSLTFTMDHVMDNRKTFMDVHQALDWVNALSEAESDGGEVSGLTDDVSWVDSSS